MRMQTYAVVPDSSAAHFFDVYDYLNARAALQALPVPFVERRHVC